MSQSSNKVVEAYVLIAIALLCMLGFSYRATAGGHQPGVGEVSEHVDAAPVAHALADDKPQTIFTADAHR